MGGDLYIDSLSLYHASISKTIFDKVSFYKKHNYHRLPTRFDRISKNDLNKKCRGDLLLDNIYDLFYNGFGKRWSEIQVDIFTMFIEACLPLIYGDEWNENKARVLSERGLSREEPFCLVIMGRRNGKTYVTSAVACCLFLLVPDVTIAIFSTGERAAKMLMTVVEDMMKDAFNLGSHVKLQDYGHITKNKEQIVKEGPDGTKRVLGCFPGSVRVSNLFYFYFKSHIWVIIAYCIV